MTNRPFIETLDRAFPWLSVGLLVSAGAAWAVGSSPVAGRTTLDVVALLLVVLVLVVVAIDALLARIGGGVAALLLCAHAVAMGVTISCIAIAAGVGQQVWPAFVIAALLVAAPAVPGVATRRSLASDAPRAALVLYLEPVNAVLRVVRGVNRFVGESREDPGWNARHGIPPERRARPR